MQNRFLIFEKLLLSNSITYACKAAEKAPCLQVNNLQKVVYLYFYQIEFAVVWLQKNLGQKSRNNFVGIFVQTIIPKGHCEIN